MNICPVGLCRYTKLWLETLFTQYDKTLRRQATIKAICLFYVVLQLAIKSFTTLNLSTQSGLHYRKSALMGLNLNSLRCSPKTMFNSLPKKKKTLHKISAISMRVYKNIALSVKQISLFFILLFILSYCRSFSKVNSN